MPVSLNSKKISIFFIGIFILIFITSIAFAEGTGIVPCTGIDCTVDIVDHFFALIDNFAKVAVPIINALAFGLIVWGGIHMITAGDDASKFDKGKKIILAVAVGIIIIYGAKFLVTSFVKGLGGNTDWFDKKTENILKNNE
jgi:hypothetical protein